MQRGISKWNVRPIIKPTHITLVLFSQVSLMWWNLYTVWCSRGHNNYSSLRSSQKKTSRAQIFLLQFKTKISKSKMVEELALLYFSAVFDAGRLSSRTINGQLREALNLRDWAEWAVNWLTASLHTARNKSSSSGRCLAPKSKCSQSPVLEEKEIFYIQYLRNSFRYTNNSTFKSLNKGHRLYRSHLWPLKSNPSDLESKWTCV